MDIETVAAIFRRNMTALTQERAARRVQQQRAAEDAQGSRRAA